MTLTEGRDTAKNPGEIESRLDPTNVSAKIDYGNTSNFMVVLTNEPDGKNPKVKVRWTPT